jgi:hypothetical protein
MQMLKTQGEKQNQMNQNLSSNVEESSFNMSRLVAQGESSTHAGPLYSYLLDHPEDCIEILRRNVFWPMLHAAIELDAADESRPVVLDILLYIVTDTACSTIITAQLLEKGKEKVIVGLMRLDAAGLALANQFTKLTENSNFVFCLVNSLMAKQIEYSQKQLNLVLFFFFFCRGNRFLY